MTLFSTKCGFAVLKKLTIKANANDDVVLMAA